MNQTKLPRHLAEQLAQDIKDNFDAATLQRGLEYFKKSRVQNVDILDLTIKSLVRGTENYHVIIDLKDFNHSSCSCPVRSFCKHIAATFFYVNTIYQWPDLFMQEFKSQTPNQVNHPPKRSIALKNPHPDGPVEAWTRYFDKKFKEVIKGHQSYLKYTYDDYTYGYYYINKILPQLKEEILICSEAWPEADQQIYQFIAKIFILTCLEKQKQGRQNFYLNQYLIEQYEAEFYAAIPEALSPEQKQKYQPFLYKAIDLMRDALMINEESLFNWLFFYRFTWTTLFCYPEWVAKELAVLQSLLHQANKSNFIRNKVILAIAHFQIMNGNSLKTREMLQSIPSFRINWVDYYLFYYQLVQDWDKFTEWLLWLTSLLDQANPREFNLICQSWLVAAENTGLLAEAEQTLKTWLPRSSDYYGQLLIKTNQYQKWVDLQIFYWLDNHGHIPTNELQQIEKAAPASLLPLYHQWVIRLVNEKNRPAYKEAVKLLKKIRTIYKKLRRSAEFEIFLPRLVALYPRSRALHEEMRKGKLIS